MSTILNQPIVLDNGSGVLKAGFAGTEVPKLVFPNIIGRPKHKKVMVGTNEENVDYIGKGAEQFRGLLKIKYPMEHGVVMDWGQMEKIWDHTFSELKIQPEEHPVLLTEAPLNPTRNREKAAQIFFETFNVPALFVSMQAVLSLYASGKVTGTVLDCGDGVTHSVPIYEGFAITNAIQRIDLAGRDVTEYLQLLLRKSGYNFTTSAEKEIVRTIKEKACYIEYDPARVEGDLLESDNMKETIKRVYKLPDGSTLELGTERFQAAEVLFNPNIIGEEVPGIHQCIVNSIQRSDMDLRTILYDNIILAGGTTCFEGFGNRLLKELKSLKLDLTPKQAHFKIFAPPERRFSTWIGGSILANLPSFSHMWVEHREYDEVGASIIHKTFFSP
jgi:centractin